MQRLVGRQAASINYRHVIDSLVRKPGAFADYRYREEMFPSSYFRFAYDLLGKQHSEKVADKMYLQILKLAADESQQVVEDILRVWIAGGEAIDIDALRLQVAASAAIPLATDIDVEQPNLSDFDFLIPTFSKDGTDDHESETQDLDDAPQSDPKQEQGGDQDGPEQEPDVAVQGIADADVPRSVYADGSAGRSGAPDLPGISFGADDAGVPSPQRGSDQANDDSVTASDGQDLGDVRSDEIAHECSSATGDATRRIVFGSAGEHLAIRQTGQRKEPCVVCIGGTAGAVGTQCSVYDVQPVGSTTLDRQTRLAAAEVDQAVLVVRGSDHRRPGLRTTESRGDGGVVHTVGGALRTGQRTADEQLGVLEVGPDIQRCDDDRGRDRPLGASQRDHRVERPELPRGEGQTIDGRWQIHYRRGTRQELLAGNSNCR